MNSFQVAMRTKLLVMFGATKAAVDFCADPLYEGMVLYETLLQIKEQIDEAIHFYDLQ